MAIATLSHRANTLAMRPSAKLQQQQQRHRQHGGLMRGSGVSRAAAVAPRAWYRSSCGGSSNSWSSADAERFMRDAMSELRDAGAFSVYWGPQGFSVGSNQQCRPTPGAASSSTSTSQRLPIDVVERDDGYVLYADVPGLSKRDLRITLGSRDSANGGRRALKIEGARALPWAASAAAAAGDSDTDDKESPTTTTSDADTSTKVRRQERRAGGFSRAWWLPDDADAEAISAKVADGVLTVTVLKRPPPPEQQEQPISIS